MPTKSLPWCTVLSQVDPGTNSIGLREADWVVGLFIDGDSAQHGIIIGIMPGMPEDAANPTIGFNDPGLLKPQPRPPEGPQSLYPLTDRLTEPTTSRLARNENIAETIIAKKRADIDAALTGTHITSGVGSDVTCISAPLAEPPTPYNAKYPFNHVYESESGHYHETDDTPGAERLHDYHRSGSFKEYHTNGTVVNKIKNEKYEIVESNKFTHSKKDIHSTANEKHTTLGKYINHIGEIDVNLDSGVNRNRRIGNDKNTLIGHDSNTLIDHDINLKVINKAKTLIVNSEHSTVLTDKNTLTTLTENRTIGVDKITTIGHNKHTVIGHNKEEYIQGDYNLVIEGDFKIRVGGNVIIDATATQINSASINLEGTNILINGSLYTLIKGTLIGLDSPLPILANIILATEAESLGAPPLPPIPSPVPDIPNDAIVIVNPPVVPDLPEL